MTKATDAQSRFVGGIPPGLPRRLTARGCSCERDARIYNPLISRQFATRDTVIDVVKTSTKVQRDYLTTFEVDER